MNRYTVNTSPDFSDPWADSWAEIYAALPEAVCMTLLVVGLATALLVRWLGRR